MAAVFGDPETSVTLGRYLSENAPQELRAIKQAPFQKPPLSDTHWPAVREYLLEQMQLPVAIVDQAHDNGLLYSDNRKNAVFLRERDSGAFIRQHQSPNATKPSNARLRLSVRLV